MPTPLDLTIAIPVRNEAQNLPGCIGAIGPDLARHIVVIDSGSTDDTVAVAESLGAEVVNFVWDGKFPKKRNWYLRNHTPTTKWVLFLDADECGRVRAHRRGPVEQARHGGARASGAHGPGRGYRSKD
jgi:cellulose synthase/poly-beta-1,6-N-acetylglucosamine synthase-like glycosyltransferase